MRLTEDLVLQFEVNDADNPEVPHSHYIGQYISIEHANRILRDEMSRWPVVVAPEPKGYMWRTGNPEAHELYRSRIVPPQPIPKETAEDVLRDLVNALSVRDTPNFAEILPALERARKVLK